MIDQQDQCSFKPLPQPVRITEHHWPEGTLPLVSISCVTYNHANYIRDAIDSFLMQETTFPVEVLIHDDASTDSTAGIVRQYEAQHPQIIKPIYQVVNQFSRGIRVGQVFNFTRVLGRYVAICDGDDYWIDRSKLQVQVSCLENSPDVSVCYGPVYAIDQHGAALSGYKGGAEAHLTAQQLADGHALNTSTAMFRVSYLHISRDVLYAPIGDITIWSRLGCNGRGVYLGNAVAANYRVTDKGIWSGLQYKEQRMLASMTYLALSHYHAKRGNQELAHRFIRKTIIEIFESIPSKIQLKIVLQFIRSLVKKLDMR